MKAENKILARATLLKACSSTSRTKILRNIVRTINENGEKGIHALVDEMRKVLDQLFVCHIEAESLFDLHMLVRVKKSLYLYDSLFGLNVDIGYIGLLHQGKQIEYKIDMLSQNH